MCTGSCGGNQVYLGTWVKFVRCLNFFINKPIQWCTETEEEIIRQSAFSSTINVCLMNELRIIAFKCNFD